MLFKKELYSTRDLREYQSLTSKLLEAGIKYTFVTNSPTNPGRYHGVPMIKSEAAYEYRIFVSRKDFDLARSLI